MKILNVALTQGGITAPSPVFTQRDRLIEVINHLRPNKVAAWAYPGTYLGQSDYWPILYDSCQQLKIELVPWIDMVTPINWFCGNVVTEPFKTVAIERWKTDRVFQHHHPMLPIVSCNPNYYNECLNTFLKLNEQIPIKRVWLDAEFLLWQHRAYWPDYRLVAFYFKQFLELLKSKYIIYLFNPWNNTGDFLYSKLWQELNLQPSTRLKFCPPFPYFKTTTGTYPNIPYFPSYISKYQAPNGYDWSEIEKGSLFIGGPQLDYLLR